MIKNTERCFQRIQGAFVKPRAYAQHGELFAETLVPVNETGIRTERETLEYTKVDVAMLWQMYPNLRMIHLLLSANNTPLL